MDDINFASANADRARASLEALLDDQSEAPVLQFERLGAKKFAPPAGQ